MVLEFPVRTRADPGEAERPPHLDLPVSIRRRLPVLWWMQRHRRALTIALMAFAVLGYSSAWTRGALVLEGQGSAMYVRMAIDHIGAGREVPYWLPNLWAGSPIWAATPSLPTLLLLPFATILGPDAAVKLGILAFQVVGACGAYALARSLWSDRPAALVAGVLYGLQPVVVAYGALAGSHPTLGVLAVAPWLAWSLRKGLRGDGTRYVLLAGLCAGFAVLMQAEYAIGLAILCAILVAVEAGRVGTGRNPASFGRLLGRASGVVAVGLGTVAYWLFPFLSLSDRFVLSPPELVQGELVHGAGARIGRELGTFFARAGELSGAVGFDRQDLLPRLFQLGWVCLALTLLTLVFLPRRDRDGTLSAVLLSGALGVWLSTGAVPLASSGPAERTQWVAFVLAGLAAGVLVGTFLRPMRLGRLRFLFLAAAAVFLAAVPYLTPFLTLQKLMPLFETLRLPRLYVVAPLALTLGAAFPVVLAREWAEKHRSGSTPAALSAALSISLAVAIVGVFLVDVWPNRSYYRVRPPASAAVYREVEARLADEEGDFRVAPTQLVPAPVAALLGTERPLTIGWPHFVASGQVWRLTAEPFNAPAAYRERAYGLSATRFQVLEKPVDKGTAAEAVNAVDLAPNPRALPMVRAHAHTVAMATRDITPELAVALAHRNVGVFTGSPAASPALAATTVVDVRSTAPCEDDTGTRIDRALASQLGVACGLHAWLDTLFAGVDLLNIGPGVGGTFRATTNRLQGISAYLDRPPDRAEVALYEMAAGGRSLGRELARGMAVGVDEYGMAAFTLDPIPDSAGKEYAFVLTCPRCPADRVPRLIAGHTVDKPGNLLVGGESRRDRAAAFAPIYEAVAADPPSSTTVRPDNPKPGRWRVEVDGAAPALVVVAEAWFPGWEAKVDGRKAPLVEADGGFLGVPVDAGSHVVTLEYHRPAAAVLGRLVTLATLLTVAVLALLRRRRPRTGGGAGDGAAPRARRPPTAAPEAAPVGRARVGRGGETSPAGTGRRSAPAGATAPPAGDGALAPRAVLTRVAASRPTSPARPKAAPTHAGPVPSPLRGLPPGVRAIGGAVTTEARSTATSTEATPRTASAPFPPQATTVSTGRFDATPATSKPKRYSTSRWAGPTSWVSFSASPTNSSMRLSSVGAEARPRTVTWPAKVAPAVGSSMLTMPASGPWVGQVLGMAPAGAARDAVPTTRRNSRRRVTGPTLSSYGVVGPPSSSPTATFSPSPSTKPLAVSAPLSIWSAYLPPVFSSTTPATLSMAPSTLSACWPARPFTLSRKPISRQTLPC